MDSEKTGILSVIYVPLLIFAMTAVTFAAGYYIKTAYLSVYGIPYEHYAYNLRELVTGGYIVIIYTILLAAIIYYVRHRSRDYNERRKAVFRAGNYAIFFTITLTVVLFLPLDPDTTNIMNLFQSAATAFVASLMVMLTNNIGVNPKKPGLYEKFLTKLNNFILATHNILEVVFIFAVVSITLPVVAEAMGRLTANNKNDFYEIVMNDSEEPNKNIRNILIYEGSDKIIVRKYNENTKRFEIGYRVIQQEDVTLAPYSKNINIEKALSNQE